MFATISAIYLHIPFCRTICPFCSFAVLKNRLEKHQSYINLLEQEVKCLRERFDFDCSSIISIYFGGGTPSCFNRDEHAQVMDIIRATFTLPDSVQWSIELNPEDVNVEYLRQLNELGFSRVSLGVQSFNDQGLKLLGRSHNAPQSDQAIQIIQDCGIENINLDLIFGYKEQSISEFRMDLAEFVNHHPQHISAYCLNIEDKTALKRDISWQKWQSDQEELLFHMYETLVTTLNLKGLRQYEVSNFAIKGFESPQNLVNWGGENYLGLGMGAHSFVAPNRWGNYRRWKDYRIALNDKKSPFMFYERLSEIQRFDEELMIKCRSSEGIDARYFKKKYGVDLNANCSGYLEEMIKNKILRVVQNHWVLTTKGLWIADEVAATIAGSADHCDSAELLMTEN